MFLGFAPRPDASSARDREASLLRRFAPVLAGTLFFLVHSPLSIAAPELAEGDTVNVPREVWEDVVEELRSLRSRVGELERRATTSTAAPEHVPHGTPPPALRQAVEDVLRTIRAEEGAGAAGGSGGVVRAPGSRGIELGGAWRLRGELHRRRYSPADVDGNDTNDLFLMRTRVHLKADIAERLAGYVEIQDARVWGQEAGTASNGRNLDLSQGWIEWIADPCDLLKIRAGRQAVAFSDQRIVGALEWSNTGRRFDGVTARWDDDHHALTSFWYRVAEGFVEPAGRFGPTVEGGDTDTDLFGAWWTGRKVLPSTTAEAYVVWLRNGNPAGSEPRAPATTTTARGNTDFGTFGARLHGKSEDGAWDWDFQAAMQDGDLAGDSLRAHAWRAELGHTFKDTAWTPRLAVEIDRADGESSTSDGERDQFQVIAPTNHGYYGISDYAAWSNLDAWAVHLGLKPSKDVAVKLSYWRLDLDETAGGWVLASGRRLRAGADSGLSSGLGDEVDLQLTYKLTPNVTWGAGWSHFRPRGFVRDTQGPEGTVPSADFGYLMLNVRF